MTETTFKHLFDMNFEFCTCSSANMGGVMSHTAASHRGATIFMYSLNLLVCVFRVATSVLVATSGTATM